ncbi:MAG: AarF/ABC1/UbiB kinase family protein [Planctomycetes bacterium]|nr:AarF/ABC1/UbiB kinase family protein [Planctomycetota bacterium]
MPQLEVPGTRSAGGLPETGRNAAAGQPPATPGPRLLYERFTPTPLVDPASLPPVGIDEHPRAPRFRIPFVAWHLSGLAAGILWLLFLGFLARRPRHRDIGRKARQFCEKMGILWIKTGQLLSMRTDILPFEICDELMKLTDRTRGFSPDAATRILEEELGGPLDLFFLTFDRLPFAAASTAQIHRATLRPGGVLVAVKVQRPHLERVFRSDMVLVRSLFGLLKWLAIMPYMRWDEFIWEIERIMEEEIDYRYEAANLRRMKKTLRRHKVHVPKVFSRYTTQRVLVMEFVRGVLMSDYLKVLRTQPEKITEWCRINQVNPGEVGRRLVFSINRQLYEDQLFHGDLHPGNIILLRENRFAFIDFGCIGFLDRDFLRIYEYFIDALVAGQHAKAADFYLLLQRSIPSGILAELKEELVRVMKNWHTRTSISNLPYSERSVLNISYELPRVAARYQLPANWEFMRVGRSFMTLDGSMIELMPDANFTEITQAYIRAKNRRLLQRIAQCGGSSATRSGFRSVQEQVLVTSNEQVMLRGATIRRFAQVFDSSGGGVDQSVTTPFLRVSSGLVILSGLFLLLTYLYQYTRWIVPEPGSPLALVLRLLPHLDVQVWIVLFCVFLYAVCNLSTFQHRLKQAEARG